MGDVAPLPCGTGVPVRAARSAAVGPADSSADTPDLYGLPKAAVDDVDGVGPRLPCEDAVPAVSRATTERVVADVQDVVAERDALERSDVRVALSVDAAHPQLVTRPLLAEGVDAAVPAVVTQHNVVLGG